MTTADLHAGTARDAAEAEAARWLIALQEDEGDSGLRERLEAWRRADPAHGEAWSEVARVYGALDRVPPAHADRWARFARTAGQPVREEVMNGAQLPRGRHWGRRVAWSTAAAALAACLALLLLPGLLLELRADYATGLAELRSLRLEDGTTVRLAPESAVEISFADGERKVRLLEGRAFFEVAPDASRPFRVQAEKAAVTVLGTAFELRLARDGVEIAVAHGRVRASLEGASPTLAGDLSKAPLTGGEWLRLSWNGALERGRTAAASVAPWRHGRIVARDRPLSEVVDELRDYFPGRILLAGDDLADRTLTGVYHTAEPEAALRSIASAHGARVRQVTPWLLVISEL